MNNEQQIIALRAFSTQMKKEAKLGDDIEITPEIRKALLADVYISPAEYAGSAVLGGALGLLASNKQPIGSAAVGATALTGITALADYISRRTINKSDKVRVVMDPEHVRGSREGKTLFVPIDETTKYLASKNLLV